MEIVSHPRPKPSLRRSRVALALVAALLSHPPASAVTFFDLDPASPSAGTTDTNAFSYRGGPFSSSNRISFSVDRLATGVVGTGVFRQARPGSEEAHGDVFHTNRRGNNESVDEQRLGLIPGFFGDDLDALEIRNPTANTYFSIETLSASNNFGAAQLANDIFLNSLSTLFASGETDLGLGPNDDIDALHLFDTGRLGLRDPGVDYAVFSLSSISPTILDGGFAPGDLLYTEFDGSFSLWRSAADLGLAANDDLNAVSIPEPEFSLLLLAAAGILLRRRSLRA